MDADLMQSKATCLHDNTNLKPPSYFSHCLTDVFQVLLYIVYDLHSSLRNPGSWAKHCTHAALVQELIVLQAQRGWIHLTGFAVHQIVTFLFISLEGKRECFYRVSVNVSRQLWLI